MSFLPKALHPIHPHDTFIVVCTLICKKLWLWFALFVISFFRNSILSFEFPAFIYMLLEHITFHYMTLWWCWQGTTNKHSNKCNLSPAGMNGYGMIINLIVAITMRVCSVQSIFAHSANIKFADALRLIHFVKKYSTCRSSGSCQLIIKYLTIPITQSQQVPNGLQKSGTSVFKCRLLISQVRDIVCVLFLISIKTAWEWCGGCIGIMYIWCDWDRLGLMNDMIVGLWIRNEYCNGPLDDNNHFHANGVSFSRPQVSLESFSQPSS